MVRLKLIHVNKMGLGGRENMSSLVTSDGQGDIITLLSFQWGKGILWEKVSYHKQFS